MSRRYKLLQKMRDNPKNWHIEDLKFVAEYFGFVFRQPGTSHVTFSNGKQRVTVPSHKPIKSIYIQKFIAMIDQAITENKNDLN
jgi:predicted RNA binding protein YcfA (HicA-like mRNA interferase family)